MARNNRYFFTLLLLLSSVAASAQMHEIRGTVIDLLTKETIPFMNIAVKGTVKGTQSDLNGFFSLSPIEPCVLQFSAIGYKTVELEITENDLRELILISVPVSQVEVGAITIGCNPTSKEIYPTIETINGADFDDSFIYPIAGNGSMYSVGLKICPTAVIDEWGYTDFYFNPTDFQLKCILTRNR